MHFAAVSTQGPQEEGAFFVSLQTCFRMHFVSAGGHGRDSLYLPIACISVTSANADPSLAAAHTFPNPEPHPSISMITIDTLRADHLSCYGYRRIETPSIDKLASEEIRLRGWDKRKVK